jgi:hypothetical protein
LLKQVEAEAIRALIPHRKIREDEVSRSIWFIQVCHASYRHACQDRRALVCHEFSSCDRALRFQSGEEEEVGIVDERDVGLIAVVMGIRFEDVQFNDWRRIDRAAVGVRCSNSH